MARGRLISKSLGSSRKFHSLLLVGGKYGDFCQVLFPLLIVNADDFGRLPGDAFTIKNVVLPTSRRPERDFERALEVITEAGLIDRYAANGDMYIQINKFDEHQPNLQKRTKSKFPESPGISVKVLSNLTQSNLTESKRTHTCVCDPDLFDQFWTAFPKKKAKDAALRAWTKRNPNAELLAVMLRAIGRQQSSPDWQRDSGRFIPFPATWLNGARWLDVEQSDLDAERPDMNGHVPACKNMQDCNRKAIEEARALKAEAV